HGRRIQIGQLVVGLLDSDELERRPRPEPQAHRHVPESDEGLTGALAVERDARCGGVGAVVVLRRPDHRVEQSARRGEVFRSAVGSLERRLASRGRAHGAGGLPFHLADALIRGIEVYAEHAGIGGGECRQREQEKEKKPGKPSHGFSW
ncbi:MAG: hypothetical protein Q9167_005954, partial [Letrouitia subvulpina]